MSELTNERLEEIASGQNTVSIPEAVELARELLALRTLRDAGDEEIEQMKGMIRKCIYGIPDSEGKIARDMLDKIVDIAITRGQQLREVRESCPCNCHNQPSSKEAMGLDEHSNCGECIKGLLQEADVMQDSLCEKYESELREALEEKRCI